MSRANRGNIPEVDYYDCSNKSDGNYVHPHDCTRFISCSNGLAHDMACPDCDPNEPLCDGSPYLRYDAEADRCEWPAETPCVTDPQSGN